IAITVSLGLVSLAATVVPMSIFVLNLTTMIGLGVGIDYSLLVVTRFREELEYAPSRLEAAEETIRTASRTVVTSGGAVIVGFLALMLVPLQETRSVGLAGVFVVATSVVLAVTFLPAVLAILGRHVDRPRWLERRLRRLRFGGGWNRYARAIARHPLRAVSLSGALALALALPALWLRMGLPVVGFFPTDTDSARGLAVLQNMGHGGALRPLKLVLETTQGGLSTRVVEKVRALVYSLNLELQQSFISANLAAVDLVLRGGSGSIGKTTFTLLGIERAHRQLVELARSHDPAVAARARSLDQFVQQLRGVVGKVGEFLRATANPIVLVSTTRGGRAWLLSAQIQVYALAVTLAFVAILLATAMTTAERETFVIGR
ncbi:MAG: hypothetical protein B7Z72_13015, partial [Gemmatimonadetes bacterium 21-71-4]